MKISPYVIPGMDKLVRLSLNEEFDVFIQVVSKRYGFFTVDALNARKQYPITRESIIAKNRYSALVYMRHMFIYFLMNKKSRSFSYNRVGILLGTDHSTIIHGYKAFVNRISTNAELPLGLKHMKTTAVEDYRIVVSLIQEQYYKL